MMSIANIRHALLLILAVTLLGCGVKLQPPDRPTPRTLDVRLPSEAAESVPTASDALEVRLLDTRSTLPASYAVLHRSTNGELREDAVWNWSTPPATLVDRALHLTAAADESVEIVDQAAVPRISATLVAFHLESSQGTEIVGSVDLRITDADRVVHTTVITERATVSSKMPGDLAVVAGELLERLARRCWEVVRRN